jgi:hypothetical protein
MTKSVRVLLIILALVLIGFLGFRFGLRSYTKQFSPEASAAFHENGLDVQVEYCQPSKKDRLIFGTEAEKALVPYGKVWRTGANEATLLTVGEDVTLAGKPLKAGKYTLWTVPGPENWQVVINGQTGQWGTEYDETQDVFRAEVPARTVAESEEKLEMNFVGQPGGADLVLHWDTREVAIPVRSR